MYSKVARNICCTLRGSIKNRARNIGHLRPGKCYLIFDIFKVSKVKTLSKNRTACRFWFCPCPSHTDANWKIRLLLGRFFPKMCFGCRYWDNFYKVINTIRKHNICLNIIAKVEVKGNLWKSIYLVPNCCFFWIDKKIQKKPFW